MYIYTTNPASPPSQLLSVAEFRFKIRTGLVFFSNENSLSFNLPSVLFSVKDGF